MPLATIAITLTTTAVTPSPVPMMDAIMVVSFILLLTISRAGARSFRFAGRAGYMLG